MAPPASTAPPLLAAFDWLPPGFSVVAELIALVGGFYGFILLVREIARARRHPPTLAPRVPDEPHAAAPPGPALSQPLPPAPAAAPASERIPATELAVIGAVCHLVLSRPHRIVSIWQTGGTGDPWSGALDYISWSREGRRDIFTSHQLR